MVILKQKWRNLAAYKFNNVYVPELIKLKTLSPEIIIKSKFKSLAEGLWWEGRELCLLKLFINIFVES